MSWRCSTARESCERARIGTSRSRGEHLQRARDLRDLLDAVLGVRAGRHQLQVVDDDQAEVRLARLEAPGLASGSRSSSIEPRVVDVDRRLRRARRRPPSSRGQSSFASWPVRRRCELDLGPREHISRCGDLELRHLEREHARPGCSWRTARFAAMQSASADLPIARAAGDDDQVARLEARGERSRSRKPVGVPGDLAARLVELRDLLEALLTSSSRCARSCRGSGAARGRRRSARRGRRAPASRPGGRSRAAAISSPTTDQAAQRRHLADDARVVGRVRRSPGRASPARGCASLPPTSSSSPFSSSSSATVIASTGSAVLVEVERGAVDLRVRLAVEVARVDDLARPPRSRRGDSIIAPRTYSSASRFWGGRGAVEIVQRQRRRRRLVAVADGAWAIRGQVKRSRGLAATVWKARNSGCGHGGRGVCAGMTERMFAQRADGAVDENAARSGKFAAKSTSRGRPVEKRHTGAFHSSVDNSPPSRLPAGLAPTRGCGRKLRARRREPSRRRL